MEQSLQRLTESIAAYTPSTTAADELVAANEAVNDNLDQRKTLISSVVFKPSAKCRQW